MINKNYILNFQNIILLFFLFILNIPFKIPILILLINLFYYLSDGSSSTLKEISGFLALYLISIYTEVLRTKNRIIKSINI